MIKSKKLSHFLQRGVVCGRVQELGFRVLSFSRKPFFSHMNNRFVGTLEVFNDFSDTPPISYQGCDVAS
jgi:hypothetical protein